MTDQDVVQIGFELGEGFEPEVPFEVFDHPVIIISVDDFLKSLGEAYSFRHGSTDVNLMPLALGILFEAQGTVLVQNQLLSIGATAAKHLEFKLGTDAATEIIRLIEQRAHSGSLTLQYPDDEMLREIDNEILEFFFEMRIWCRDKFPHVMSSLEGVDGTNPEVYMLEITVKGQDEGIVQRRILIRTGVCPLDAHAFGLMDYNYAVFESPFEVKGLPENFRGFAFFEMNDPISEKFLNQRSGIFWVNWGHIQRQPGILNSLSVEVQELLIGLESSGNMVYVAMIPNRLWKGGVAYAIDRNTGFITQFVVLKDIGGEDHSMLTPVSHHYVDITPDAKHSLATVRSHWRDIPPVQLVYTDHFRYGVAVPQVLSPNTAEV